jgi:hypothetical protein
LKKTGTHGGARRGAGAKPGSTQQRTVEKKAALTLWRERVEAELDPIITAQLELAKGLFDVYGRHPMTQDWVHVTDPATIVKLLNSGEPFVRTARRDPDSKMLINIMDRLTGKPKEQLEVTGPDNGPVRVVFEVVGA